MSATDGIKGVVPREYASAQPFRYQFKLLKEIERVLSPLPRGSRILDAGCGNGFIAGELHKRGFTVVGIDVSESGIAICKAAYPDVSFHVASICDETLSTATGGEFDAIIAFEVIEHIYSPATFLNNCRNLLKTGGTLIISTPYHGYLKNLVLALTGKMERHFQPTHEGGHIKFWSRKSLLSELRQFEFRVDEFIGIGRIPFLWKSMMVKAVKAT